MARPVKANIWPITHTNFLQLFLSEIFYSKYSKPNCSWASILPLLINPYHPENLGSFLIFPPFLFLHNISPTISCLCSNCPIFKHPLSRSCHSPQLWSWPHLFHCITTVHPSQTHIHITDAKVIVASPTYSLLAVLCEMVGQIYHGPAHLGSPLCLPTPTLCSAGFELFPVAS